MDRQNVTTGITHERQYSRRGVARLLGGGLLILGGAPVVAKKKPKFKTVTRTFGGSNHIVIEGLGRAAPYPSKVKVSGLKQGKLLDVNVLISFHHPNPQDVDIQLLAPNGKRATIMSDAGGANGLTLYQSLTLDDEAGFYLPEDETLWTGSYRPTNYPAQFDSFPAPGGQTTNVPLSTFDGINPNGTWKLLVYDDHFPHGGSIQGWFLVIKARVKK